MKFTLDSSVLVDALRQPAELELLIEFLAWALPVTALCSVVAAELLAGARNAVSLAAVESEVLGPFVRRHRVVAPSDTAWQRTGRLLATSTSAALGGAGQNDVLIAHTARELGWTVITRDSDFGKLRKLIPGLLVAAPFPRRPGS